MGQMKVVLNKCYGGYGLSRKAVDRLVELGSQEAKRYLDALETSKYVPSMDSYYIYSDDRTNLLLIQVVEELGKESFGSLSALKIVEIPDGINWYIDDYDGIEDVHEEHASWG